MNGEENDWQALYESLTLPASESIGLGEKEQVQLSDVHRGLPGQSISMTRVVAPGRSTTISRAGHEKARSSPSRRSARTGLGEMLQKRRHELGLTQRQVAAQVGVKPAHIAYLEGDRRRPSLGLLNRIAEALGLDREQLFALSHPEASLLMGPRRLTKTSSAKGAAWTEFKANKALLARNQVKPDELKLLAQINLLGKVSAPRNFLFILNAIRQAVDED